MAKWEYTSTPAIGSDLNAMGAEGWEMASVDGASLFWKRQIPDDNSVDRQILAAVQKMASQPAPQDKSDGEPAKSDKPDGSSDKSDKPDSKPAAGSAPSSESPPNPPMRGRV